MEILDFVLKKQKCRQEGILHHPLPGGFSLSYSSCQFPSELLSKHDVDEGLDENLSLWQICDDIMVRINSLGD